MKKLIVLILCLGTVGYAYAGKKYEAEIISVDYDGIVLDLNSQEISVNDNVIIDVAGAKEGIVIKAEDNIVRLSVKNNGFAKGSILKVNNAKRIGKAGSLEAEIIDIEKDVIILQINNNYFKENDKLKFEAVGNKKGKVIENKNGAIKVGITNTGFAETSNVIVQK